MENDWLYPQPKGPFQGAILDCVENKDGTEFCFYEGNEMEGHNLVYGPIKAPKEGLVPELKFGKIHQEPKWYWRKRTTQTYKEWENNHPIIGKRVLDT